MENYEDDLELNILGCLLMKPELMEKCYLEDKHFLRHKRMWLFMKSFYNKFKTFDTRLMATVATDKRQVVDYTTLIIMTCPVFSNFDKYQERLIEMYEESEKDKWIIKKIYTLANDLIVRGISIADFRNRVDKICDDANKIFKEKEEQE